LVTSAVVGPLAQKVRRTTRALLRRLRRALPFRRRRRRLSAREAYRLWSETYESQPGNPVLALESEIRASLLSKEDVRGKVVVDIGVGTGRHWGDLVSRAPRELHGVDISGEMLERLRARFPDAALHERTGTRLPAFSDASVDLIVSSLMLGHVRDVEDELREWSRLLRKGGAIVYTDFHPDALRAGAKRTFGHRGKTFEVESYLHSIDSLKRLFLALDLEITGFDERAYLGAPLVFGFCLKKRVF
jgi:SAM-dependent methyltransferase